MNARRWSLVLLSISLPPILALGGCSSSTEPEHKVGIPALGDDYVVFAWNDLGMHCLNPTYDQAVILPPYNTVWAQVVRRGNPPVVVTEGLTVEYRMVDNTWSYGKTDSHGGAFSQFWDNAPALFGVSLAQDTGLNLEDPGINNGLSGTMVVKGGHFQVNGIPVVPVNDAGLWSPYQVIEVTVRSAGVMVARTRATVPTSDEIDCAKCHGDRPFEDILAKHDAMHGTALAAAAPVLCANGTCHGSPALGQSGPGPGGYLSAAIHGAHADRDAACLDCHPGATTACNRSLAHTAPDGNCTACHGTLDDVASSIDGGRVPWASEPRCVTCHPGVAEVDTQDTLYRNAAGHGGMGCPACHGSPHAMIPSREGSDQYQSRQYQNSDRTIGSCGVCHGSSRGEGSAEFAETHGGSGGEPTACRVCHTAVSAQTASWPHRFQWKSR